LLRGALWVILTGAGAGENQHGAPITTKAKHCNTTYRVAMILPVAIEFHRTKLKALTSPTQRLNWSP
jgi:hypothetical protein